MHRIGRHGSRPRRIMVGAEIAAVSV